jgi:hypothetical protein
MGMVCDRLTLCDDGHFRRKTVHLLRNHRFVRKLFQENSWGTAPKADI